MVQHQGESHMIANNKNLQVFLVDSSRHIRRSLRELIADLPGISVCGEADNAVDAIKMLVDSATDVIVLDIRLPDSSGMSLQQKIRQIQLFDLPIIIFSAYPFPQHKLLARELGAYYFLDKAEGFTKLEETLIALANHREATTPTRQGEKTAAAAGLTPQL